MKNNELFRASGIMAIGTILSRITGFIRALLADAIHISNAGGDLVKEVATQVLGVFAWARDVERASHAAQDHLVGRFESPQDVGKGRIVRQLDKLSKKTTDGERACAVSSRGAL